MAEMLDEADLVRKAQAGEPGAFSVLSDRYWEPLRRWLYGYSGGSSHAEDITQDALLRAWTCLDQVKNPDNFRTWLFQIARRLLLDRLRAAQRDKRARQPFEIPSRNLDPLEQTIENEGSRKLAEALKRLPMKYREAYLLWTNDEWTYPQIAEVIGATEQTARWRVCVARQLLVKAMKEYLKQ